MKYSDVYLDDITIKKFPEVITIKHESGYFREKEV